MIRSTPVDRDAATTSCPAAVSFWTTCEPISPVPMTVIFMILKIGFGHGAASCFMRVMRTPR